VQPKWKFQQELMNRQIIIQAFNNCPSEQVHYIFYTVGYALEVIPKTLATNCGMDVVRIIT
jgi:chaperonin GroEL (HSP60 family)